MSHHTLRKRAWFVAAAGVVLAAIAFSGPASASNMAFKMNKVISALGSGVQGKNLVSLPDVNPYQGAGGLNALCTSLNLSANGQLVQFDANLGNINTHNCGQVETFSLDPGAGLMITDTAAAGGVIVGADTPGNSFDIFILGQTPRGLNLFPVEYHTTAVTPEDVCQQCGLSGTATVTRFDAQSGNVFAHTCGQVPVWNLVLGESLLVQEPAGTVSCTPAHF